jgi:acetyl-CoA C-acetyltransferase
MHSIAEIAGRVRSQPGAFGFVGAPGGVMTKYSAGVYSTAPAPWTPDRSAEPQAEIDGTEPCPETLAADGPATVETYTIVPGSGGHGPRS